MKKNIFNSISEEERQTILEQFIMKKFNINEQEGIDTSITYETMIDFAGGFAPIFNLLTEGKLKLSNETMNKMTDFMRAFQEEMRNMKPEDENNNNFHYFYIGTDMASNRKPFMGRD